MEKKYTKGSIKNSTKTDKTVDINQYDDRTNNNNESVHMKRMTKKHEPKQNTE